MFIRVGEVLRELRKQKGLTQEELAGERDKSNLSRVERGKQSLSRTQLETYLDRLGYDLTYFLHHVLDDAEFNVYSLRDELDNHVSNFDYVKAKEVIARIEDKQNNTYFKDGPHLQFLLKNKAWICMYEDPQNAHDMLQDAIRITIQDFDEARIESYLLARYDIEVINLLASTTHLLGNTDSAILILKLLANNVRNRGINPYEKARSLTLILHNLSIFYGSMKRYEDALELCEEAICIGQENRCYGLLPRVLYNKGYSLFHLEKKEESLIFLRDAYHTSRAFGLYELADTIKAKAKDNFGMDTI